MVLLPMLVTAQEPGPGGLPTRREVATLRPEIVAVDFEGNSTLTDEQLLSAITSRPPVPGFIPRITALFAGVILHHPFAKPADSAAAARLIDSLAGPPRYLNPKAVSEDSAMIEEVYMAYGHHDAAVTYRVNIDTTNGLASIRFIIAEGPRYPLSGINWTYYSPDPVPEKVRGEIEEPEGYDPGEPYTQAKLFGEIDRAIVLLQNNGYPWPQVNRPPTVFMVRPPHSNPPATPERFDSAWVFLHLGDRYRFGHTLLSNDTTAKGNPVDRDLILDQREYRAGEWYSREKIDETISNLYALGTFDLVTIDTAAIDPVDSALTMEITTRLRPQNELRLAPELAFERRVGGWVYNLGATGNYTRLNLLGGAERLGLNGRILVPLGRQEDIQWGVGATFQKPSNPNLPIIGNKRLGLLASGGYDYSVIDLIRARPDRDESDVALRAKRGNLLGELTWRLPMYTFLTQITARLAWQSNTYLNVAPYIDRVVDTLAPAGTPSTKRALRDELIRTIYRTQVLQGDDIELVPIISPAAVRAFNALKQTDAIALELVGDKRNDFFEPTTGYLFELRTELGLSGYAGFAGFDKFNFNGGYGKLEAGYRRYLTLGSDWTIAGRLHAGYIVQFGPLPLTPLSSRFVAGGANSIRGWGPREMLATRPIDLSGLGESVDKELLREVLETNRRLIGGLGLIEASLELRKHLFDFANPTGFRSFLNNLLIIPFVDAGNAYFRDRADLDHVSVLDNIALATGMSLGYSSPIGPVRVGFGFPVYDPVALDIPDAERWWRFDEIVYHVSIGHAF